MLCVVISLFFLQTGAARVQNKLPEFVTRCKDDAELSPCWRAALENLRPLLVLGIPEFRTPPIDPLNIPTIVLERRESTIANFQAELTNAVWTGAGDFEVADTFIDLDELVLRLKLNFPKLLLHTEARANGTILNYEVNGDGGAVVNFTKVTLDIILNGKSYDYRGNEFIRWKPEDVGITYEDVYYLDLYGFVEDPTITYFLKLAVNRGVALLSKSIRTIIGSIASFIVDAVNRVHRIYPRRVLYPV